MTNVMLIGDSIRLDAEPYVRQYLGEAYCVRSPGENCRSSSHVLENLPQWLSEFKPEIIHINCGLHDMRYEAGTHNPQNSPTTYRKKLIKIFEILQSYQAKTVWATSTPFIESWHNNIKSFKRYARDLPIYNQLAIGAASQFDIFINDIYNYLLTCDLTALVVEDGLHFNRDGRKLIAERIAWSIRQQ